MRVFGKVMLALIAGAVLVGALLYVFRDDVATKAAASMLDRRDGMRCTHPKVRVNTSLDLISVSPLECTLEKGPLRMFSAPEGFEVTMKGMKPSLVRAKHGVMDQRERDVSNVEKKSAGKIPGLDQLSDQWVKAMLDASESFSSGGPIVRVDTLVMKRAGETESVMKDFRRSSEFGWDRQTAAQILGPPKPVRLRNFEMKVTPKRGEMTLAVYLSQPDPGEKPDVFLKVDGEGLNQAKPQFDIRL